MSYRYIFYGGTREWNQNKSIRQLGIAHNSAFMMAAKTVSRDYSDFPEQIKMHKITTAANMLGKINSLPHGTLKSLDIFSHGTPYSLNFSINQNENSGLVTSFMAKMLLKAYYSDIFEGEIYEFGLFSRYVSDIKFDVFSSDARVQIHGCNTAKGGLPGDTMAESISKGLWEAGKKLAYVIAHTSKSNPNIAGAQTTIRGQDYRHGERAILTNGRIAYTTRDKGYLNHSEILNKLGSNE